jgi:putative membrane protein
MASGEKLSWTDRRFVSKTADSGQDEVQLAQLAAQRAMNPEVRQFAERLVKDHTAVNDELKGIASSKNVKIDRDDGKERAYRRLNAKAGAEFDQEFVEHMIDSHEDGIRRFEKAAKDAKDPEIRSFAAKHVDHLRQHLQQAQSLQASTMPTGRTDANAPISPRADGTSTINSGASATTPNSSPTPSTQSTNTGGTNPNSPATPNKY